MPESNERSAEFCRGAVWASKQLACEKMAALYAVDLAAAEAREAGEKKKEKTIMDAKEFTEMRSRENYWDRNSELRGMIADYEKSLANAEEVIESISDLFPDDAPHKHTETGVSLLDDVRDAMKPREATQPTAAEVQKQNNLRLLDEWKQVEERLATAAEVIEACEKALRSWNDAMNTHGEWDDGCFYYCKRSASELEPRIEGNAAALALCARWKEAYGGK